MPDDPTKRFWRWFGRSGEEPDFTARVHSNTGDNMSFIKPLIALLAAAFIGAGLVACSGGSKDSGANAEDAA